MRFGNFRLNRQRGGCFGGVLGCGLIVLVFICVIVVFASIFGLIRSSDVYQTAVTDLHQNEQAIAILGEPIKEGLFAGGSINTSGSSGSADLSIPVSGPQNSGTLYVTATKSLGVWEINQMVLEVDNERINLISGR
ncbi:MAG: cytochrome c oxidase assembly factor 1 family protein [Anaerolineales bacterium]|nr:cytochrome c oxidase assembly factor 1 family protein [Anaerolineales bacterium]